MRNLDYVVNLNARNLAKDASQTLGMIVSDIENPFFPEVIKGFEQRAREQSFDVILSDTNYDSAVMTEAATRMLRQRVRGHWIYYFRGCSIRRFARSKQDKPLRCFSMSGLSSNTSAT